MADLNWRDAIIEVLKQSGEAMHYTAIAEAISVQGLKSDVGATPANTVAATITTSLKENGPKSPFVRAARGIYALQDASSTGAPEEEEKRKRETEAGLINAFGMYWSRDAVLWTGKPKILGRQQPTSRVVDLSEEKGVYLLHDGREVVYVGRTTERPLGARLREHTRDRLASRWNRFSWFGVFPVAETGELNTSSIGDFDLNMLIITMEALLIEGLEPRQNLKSGDKFNALEFLQEPDRESRIEIAQRNLAALKQIGSDSF